MRFFSVRALTLSLMAITLCTACYGADWPTYLHDNTRSGVTEEQLTLPLTELWTHRATHAPAPAWPPPARQDFWHELRNLRPTVVYDRAFHAVVAGGTAYFGSSVDDKVYAVDMASGDVRWTFCTEGPVRLAPTIANGKVYAGSDDGWVYCLNAPDGALLWKQRPHDEDHRIPGNGRMIALRPVRTGVLVDGDDAYFCAGFFSAQGVFLCDVDARTGAFRWSQPSDAIAPQGNLLASSSRLYVPTGRTTPGIFDRASGKYQGEVPGQGGAYALLSGSTMVSGPGRASGELTLSDVNTRERLAGFADGLRMIVKGPMAYLLSREELAALDRVRHTKLARERHEVEKQFAEVKERYKPYRSKKDDPEAKKLAAEQERLGKIIADYTAQMEACYAWKLPNSHRYALILAGDVLYAGGDGEVAAYNTAHGKVLWKGKVTGKAYGLCVANGALVASTDAGTIHCFTPKIVEREHVAYIPVETDPYPADELTALYAAAADRIVEEAWPEEGGPAVKKGYCLVLGAEYGRLAYALAQRTDLQIVGIEADPDKVAVARATLEKAGLYGSRIAIHNAPLDRLPYGSFFANLIVSDSLLLTGEVPTPAPEVFRVLRPNGGVVCLGQPGEGRQPGRTALASTLKRWLKGADGAEARVYRRGGLWAIARRGALPGSGEWTQLYADASHTACSNDQVQGPMTLQWFGEPGPQDIIDRHHRPMSSLYKDGRIFVPANDTIVAVDAFNGTILWSTPVPNSRRIGALKNCGHTLVADDRIYIAVEGDTWVIDTVTGKHLATLHAPTLAKDGKARDWGYINHLGDQLYGSSQKKGASFNALDWETCGVLEGDFRLVMVSESLFSLDRFTGDTRWTYTNGAIMNNDITVLDGRIYFVESRNAKSMANTDGRMRIDDFCKSDTFLVALDAVTGAKVWEKPFIFPFEHIMFLNGAEGTLLCSGTYNKEGKVYYALYSFAADTGQANWDTHYVALDIRATGISPLEGSHGEQWQHPVINGDTIFSKPYAFDFATGKKKDYIAYRGGHGCGGVTGSAHYLYARGSNPRMYPIDVKETEGERLTHTTRPGCWLNILPAGGLVLVPESSSGCTCGYPVQTSLAFVPTALSGRRIGTK
jgi:outer membrane protein assembly factor BamB